MPLVSVFRRNNCFSIIEHILPITQIKVSRIRIIIRLVGALLALDPKRLTGYQLIIIIIFIYVMELGHFLTRSGLTNPEVSSQVCRDSICQLGNSVSLPWVIYCKAFYLHVVFSFSCIPVICLKLGLFLPP